MERLLALTPGATRPDPAKIRILAMGGRGKNHRLFPHLASALFDGKRLYIAYRSRGKDETTDRQISPQTLVRYRDNWYLDAWCHLRDDLRSFAVERIEAARTLDTPARVIGPDHLEKHFAQAYGIFAGPAEHTAVLRFSARRARWIADEQWHSRQEGRHLDDGRYELRLPFGDHRELLMDILRYGADVEVLEPEFLRRAVEEEITAMVKIYS
jgi:predicted DNA-binding transcriptional regulator YafY